MKIIYPNPEAEAAALQAQAASSWALTHRAEYDVMLSEVFPNDFPRIPGEWVRRMDVLESTCARLAGFPAGDEAAA